MTKEDITHMVREAGFTILHSGVHPHKLFVMNPEHMARFAALVAAAEREECAKVCDSRNAAYCAFSIRERGAP